LFTVACGSAEDTGDLGTQSDRFESDMLDAADPGSANDSREDGVLDTGKDEVLDNDPGTPDPGGDGVTPDTNIISDDGQPLDPGSSDLGLQDTDTPDDLMSDEGTPPDTGGYQVAAQISCTPVGNACDSPVTVTDVFASYRKDYYFPDSQYREYTDPPVDGGRFQIAAVSGVTGTVTGVTINGTNVNAMLIKPQMEWYHVWPVQVVQGQPVWFNFHSRDSKWDSAQTAQIVIQTTAGDAINAAFPVKKTRVPLTYVTTDESYSTFIIHAKNIDSKAHTLSRLLVNGRDVSGPGIACIPKTTIAAGESVMWTVPLCTPTKPGDAWTVVAEYADENPAVGAGRVIKAKFPVEGWPNEECPYPGSNDTNYNAMRAAGIDTMYAYVNSCGGVVPNLANQILPAQGDYNLLIGDDLLGNSGWESTFTDTSALAGFLTGDETDGTLWDGDNKPLAAQKADMSRRLWNEYPEVPTYNGAKTNGNIGTFAGMADIQGMDAYVAGGAPAIVEFLGYLKVTLKFPYDFLLNARNNHMPLPTWLYSQGLSPVSAWKAQPSPAEVLIQAFSVAAAGGKGLMWFQVNQEKAAAFPASWEAIAASNWTYRGIGPTLREGDITGAVKAGTGALAEMIRGRDALIVVAIDIKSSTTYATTLLGTHWAIGDVTTNLDVTIPADFGVVDVFEIYNKAVTDLSYAHAVTGRTLSIKNVKLTSAMPVKVFVLAADASVRGRMQDLMNP
jgi:hypothetical protein